MTMTLRPGTRVTLPGEVVSAAGDSHVLVRVRGSESTIRVRSEELSKAEKPSYALTDTDFSDVRTSVARNIRRFRQRANYSQFTLAEKVGVSQNSISQWETDVCAPRAYMLPVLARVLGVGVNDLMAEGESE